MTNPRDPLDMESRLRALTPRGPSAALREQVLRQARAGLARPVTPWQRICASWTFRWGWAVALVAMAVIGTVSERSFRSARWGEAAPASAVAVAGSGMERRTAELQAVLRIESEADPPDTAVFGWGDPNRCDRDDEIAPMLGVDAGPRREPGPSHDTRRSPDEADRRSS